MLVNTEIGVTWQTGALAVLEDVAAAGIVARHGLQLLEIGWAIGAVDTSPDACFDSASIRVESGKHWGVVSDR